MEKMKISEFAEKHREDIGISYHMLHRLIREGVLKENIHYRRTFRGSYEKYTVIERPLVKFLLQGAER